MIVFCAFEETVLTSCFPFQSEEREIEQMDLGEDCADVEMVTSQDVTSSIVTSEDKTLHCDTTSEITPETETKQEVTLNYEEITSEMKKREDSFVTSQEEHVVTSRDEQIVTSQVLGQGSNTLMPGDSATNTDAALQEAKKETKEEDTEQKHIEMEAVTGSAAVLGSNNKDVVETAYPGDSDAGKPRLLEIVHVQTTKGVVEVDKANLPHFSKYQEHIDILPQGNLDLKYQCKLCCKVFAGAGSKEDLGAAERIVKHIDGHMQRKLIVSNSKSGAPNILKRSKSSPENLTPALPAPAGQPVQYEEYISVVPGENADLRYQCRLCSASFTGAASKEDFGAVAKIVRHVDSHMQRKVTPSSNTVASQENPILVQAIVSRTDDAMSAPLVEKSATNQTENISAVRLAQSAVTSQKAKHAYGSFSQFMVREADGAMLCRLCGKAYAESSRNAFRRHLQTVHSLNETPSPEPAQPQPPPQQPVLTPVLQNMWQCKFCAAMFPPGNIRNMEDHLHTQHARDLNPNSPLLARTPGKAVTSPAHAPSPASSALQCKFCGEIFPKATVMELKRHLQSRHRDKVDLATLAQVGGASVQTSTLTPVGASGGLPAPGVRTGSLGVSAVVSPVADVTGVTNVTPAANTTALNQRVAAAVSQTLAQQAASTGLDSVNFPRAHISLSVNTPNAAVMAQSGPAVFQSGTTTIATTNTTMTAENNKTMAGDGGGIVLLQQGSSSPCAESHGPHVPLEAAMLVALVSRLQEYEPFVQIVSDKFGPGYKCRLCGKMYSSSALSPIRRHLTQMHQGDTYRGLTVPNNVSNMCK